MFLSHCKIGFAYIIWCRAVGFACLFLLFHVTVLGQSKARKYVVAQHAANASDRNPGTSSRPFKTISRAALLAQPGDTILVHSGIYREWVAPLRGGEEGHPITYMAAPKETVIISGSEIYFGAWQPVAGHPGVFSSRVRDGFFTSGFDPFKIEFGKGRGGGRQGQVFIDGNELREAKKPANTSLEQEQTTVEKSPMEHMYDEEATWATPDGQTIYVHLASGAKSLERSQVEFSVRRHLFASVRRAQNYINLKGFIFEHCANDVAFPQVGAVSCRSGQHWIIENNTVRDIKTIGIDCGAEDEDPWNIPDILPQDRYYISRHHDVFTLAERRIAGRNMILNNHVSNCGQCGIAGLFSDGSVIMGNIVEGCGGVIPGFESGGIKIHGLMGGTIEGNLVRNNEAWGIWLDCGFIGSRVTRNVVVNNNISGIFFECSNGPGLIDDNVVAYNRGDGIYTHDASGVTVSNNLVFGNENFAVYMCVATDRKVPSYYYATGLYETELSACSWERIYNNIIAGNREGAIALPAPGKRAQDNLSDYNLFDESTSAPHFVEHFRNGAPHSQEQVSAARKAFEKSGDATLSGADLMLWKHDKGFSFSLRQWQSATGNDTHSRTGNIRASLNLKTYDLEVTVDGAINQLHCNPVQTLDVRDYKKFARRIDKDFQSNPMPAGKWLAGAFQALEPGTNRMVVWPVPFSYPSMPPKVAAEPLPGAPGLQPIPRPEGKEVK